MRRKVRRSLLLGFTTATAMLLIASTAYACIVYKGDLTLTGASKTSNLMTGDPSANMTYCSGRSPTTAAAGAQSSSVNVDVDPATACTGTSNQLGDIVHEVRLNNLKGFTGTDGSSWTIVSGKGCWATQQVQGTKLGEFTPSSGSFNGNFTIPSTAVDNAAGEASVFCIGEKNPPGSTRNGFLAPFRVV